MGSAAEDAARPPGTPDDVVITREPPEPVTDTTLGIPVTVRGEGTPRHRLVTIGDSLTQGFQSLAVGDTSLSYPAMIAWELGIQRDFRFPTYEGFGGIPLNLEWLLRGLEAETGPTLQFWETVRVFLAARRLLERHEDFWERGAGSRVPRVPWIYDNLAVYGWDLRDVLSLDADFLRARLVEPSDDLLDALPENADKLAGLRVLDSARTADGAAMTPLEAAARLGSEGTIEAGSAGGRDAHGIETMIVWLGSNNALPTVLSLHVRWSDENFASLDAKACFSVWRPEHFKAELAEVAKSVRGIRARHVLWGTVPHVTIAPLAYGVGGKLAPGSRFFRFYVRPWVDERAFLAHPDRYPRLTGEEARVIDSAIDQYNQAIIEEVSAARRLGLDWRVVDLGALFDSLASRRYIDDRAAQPGWWKEYEMPPEILDELGGYRPTTWFLRSGPEGVTRGGLVSLDGVHPTTVGYSLIAQEFLRAMVDAGVHFAGAGGGPAATPRIDFRRAVRADTLLTRPLDSLTSSLDLLGWLDDRFSLIARAERAMRYRRTCPGDRRDAGAPASN
jgi:hypothetical protein